MDQTTDLLPIVQSSTAAVQASRQAILVSRRFVDQTARHIRTQRAALAQQYAELAALERQIELAWAVHALPDDDSPRRV